MMFHQQKGVCARIIGIVALIVAIYGSIPMRASAEGLPAPAFQGEDCEPNGGQMWTVGPFKPKIALQAQQELNQKGIEAAIEARSFGEMDSCDTYEERGIDFTLNLSEAASGLNRQELTESILPVLEELGKPSLGNVKLFSAQGESILLNLDNPTPAIKSLETVQSLVDPVTRKVYVIAYDPLLSSGQTLSEYMHWNNYAALTQQAIDFFTQASHGEVFYTVADTTVVNDGWPELVDGFRYTEQTYLAAWSNPSLHHNPTGVNYNKIVNSSQFDICGKLNRGEIDEVWIYNGPWFGFYESTLAGPNAYPINSPPVSGTNNCNRLLPIMGPSLERRVEYFVEDFSHRAEATLAKVYGTWQQNNTSHIWNKFTLIKAQSPSYSYSGCGVAHYPPNAPVDIAYLYNSSSSVLSNCADFVNYPNLGDPLQVAQPITCSAWGCTTLGFFQYWFGHFPHSLGCGPDNFTNDWWQYMLNPDLALHPYTACSSDARLITGNAGTSGATLNYTDEAAKMAFTDNYGNYSLIVSTHWSGAIIPSKPGYMFSPASLSYTDTQSDLAGQDYTAQAVAATSLYVNLTTGNNSNSCTSINAPCRNIQEAINKAGVDDVIYVAGGTYLFSTNSTPNVVIIRKSIKLSGGWNSDFTSQSGTSIINGGNVNNGILLLSGTTTVENFIIENSRSSNSGAIYLGDGTLTLTRSILRNNVAGNGAGIFVDKGVLKVINSIILGNRAGGKGGGIYASTNSGTSISIQNSSITDNQAAQGGGISQVFGTYSITNTIIANNMGSVSSPDCNGTIASASFNIIENPAGCSITSGSHNLYIEPQPLSVIDAGSDLNCPAVDQRGVTRPQGSHCDIGAYEYVNTTAPTVDTFTTASLSGTLDISITTFTASDDLAVTGYMVTATSIPPPADASGWSSIAPTTYTVASDGPHTLYPWAKDGSGNVSSVFGMPVTVVVDTTAPTVTLSSATPDLTNTSPIPVTVQFSETVTDFLATDITVTNGTADHFVAVNGDTYTFDLIPAGQGVITAAIAQNVAMDVARNGNMAATPLSRTYDGVSPTVTITRSAGSANPTDAASVDFTVTFSEPVTGVETEAPFPDFSLTTSEGIRNASITAVSGDGTTYTVTVNTGIGSGTLQLNVVDDDSIQDAAGNPLGGVGTGTLPGESYTIEKQSTLPGRPIGLLPATGFVTNNTQPTFSWDSVANAVEYEIVFASDSGFTPSTSYFVNDPTFTPEVPLAEGKHYWRVRAYNLANEPGAWSAVRSLTIDLLEPAAPVLQSPLDGATVRTVPTFRWKAASGAVLYQFELDNDEDFSSPVVSVEQRTLYRKPAGGLRGTYFWRVRAKDAAGNWSEWSPVFTVTIVRSR